MPASRLDVFWAKSPSAGKPPHSLLAHTLDTVACALELLEREPRSSRIRLAKSLQLEHDLALRWLALVIGLHDFGKATPAFAWKRGFTKADIRIVEQGLMAPHASRPASPRPHGHLSQLLLPQLLAEAGWGEQAAKAAAAAVGMHHGRRFQSLLDGVGASQVGAPVWAELRAELFGQVLGALDLQGAPAPKASLPWPAQVVLAGVTSVADWIASSLDYGGDASDTRAYLSATRERCRERLESMGWRARTPLTTKSAFADLFPAIGNPRPLQLAMEEALRQTNGPTLLLVEAPMGEGKTEAALLAHCVLQSRNEHRGLYFALPTQATGNAMFARLQRFLEAVGTGREFDIQLVHGLAAINPDYQALRGLSLSGVEDEDSGRPCAEASVRASEWFSARKRSLLSEYGAGTVDQALIGVLPAKHHFVRLFGLANRVVVIDEVHAYDAYTGRLIADLLRWLKALGSSAVVMSATLPAAMRADLLRAWHGEPTQTNVPYPRISRVDGNGTSTITVKDFGESTRRATVRVRRLSADVDAIADEAIRQTADGGCLLVLANTVGRAQRIYSAIKERDDKPEVVRLFHARFPAGQRLVIEKTLTEDFGPAAPSRPARAIVVATQVAEQSLDVDFDGLISDLAPIDLLLQRLGRVHRHARARPSHLATPVLWIAGLADWPALPPIAANHWNLYPEIALLRTALLLAERPSIELPDAIDGLVQACYAEQDLPVPGPDWDQPIRDAKMAHAAACDSASLKGIHASIGDPWDSTAERGWQSANDDDDHGDLAPPAAQVVTRLGDPSLRVIPLYRVHGGVSPKQDGPAINGSTLPIRDLLDRVIPIAHRGLVQALRAVPPPVWMAEEPLLRSCRALELDPQSRACVGATEVVLDDELGLVIGRR